MLSKLRREIADFIAAFADHTFQFSMQFSVSLEVAKEQPLKLMKERDILSDPAALSKRRIKMIIF
jgi:hypothetical protein